MFIVALYTVAKLCKQPRCPTTNEWIKKIYIYTMLYYLVIKNETMLFAGKWIKPELIILSEIRQAQKQRLHVFPQI
jgi:hypothetical protein